MAAISLSVNPVIASLRLLLSAWRSQILATDERVITGINALVSDEIISNERGNEILGIA
jgi:hypothetical protein